MKILPGKRQTRSSCLAILFAYEDLQMRNLVRNHKLAKSISDVSWGRFLAWVQYYASLHGTEAVSVPPHKSSQECSGCGTLVIKTLSTRTHVCPTCGLVLDRDINAALIIWARAYGNGCTHRERMNAWGHWTSTLPVETWAGQARWWNQESPA